MAQHFQSEPYLISQLLHVALENIFLNVIQEGLVRHAWNDRQLAELQRQLARTDLLGAFQVSMNAERCYNAQSVQELEQRGWMGRIRNPYPLFWNVNASRFQKLAVFLLIPKGWLYQNLVRCDAHFLAAFGSTAIGPSQHRAFVAERKLALESLEKLSHGPYAFLARQTMPPVGGHLVRVVNAQSGIDQALVACALERYRLAHRRYPDTLAELVPAFADRLPVDLVNGGNLRYARVGDHYRLYSIGWDLKDDGGQIALDSKNGQTVDAEQGDWAWAR